MSVNRFGIAGGSGGVSTATLNALITSATANAVNNAGNGTENAVPRFADNTGKAIETTNLIVTNDDITIPGQITTGSGGTNYTLPNTRGTAGQVLTDALGDGVVSWGAGGGGGGGISGPVTSTQNAVALWNDTSGDVLKNSTLTFDGTDLKVSTLKVPANINVPTAGKIPHYVSSGDLITDNTISIPSSGVLKTNVSQVEQNALLKHTTTPSNPASGYNRMYVKSDDSLYTLNSAGTETKIQSAITNNVTSGGTSTSNNIVAWNSTDGTVVKDSDITVGTSTLTAGSNSLSLAGTNAQLTGSSTSKLFAGGAQQISCDATGATVDNILNVKGALVVGSNNTVNYTFPASRGTNGQILKSDGAGNVNYSSAYVDYNNAIGLSTNEICRFTDSTGRVIKGAGTSANKLHFDDTTDTVTLRGVAPIIRLDRNDNSDAVSNGTLVSQINTSGVMGGVSTICGQEKFTATGEWSETNSGCTYTLSTIKQNETALQPRLTVDSLGDVVPSSLKLGTTGDDYKLPNTRGANNTMLTSDGAGGVTWSTISNNVVSGGTSTQNAVPLWNNTSGTLLKNSALTFDGTDLKQSGSKIPFNISTPNNGNIPIYAADANLIYDTTLSFDSGTDTLSAPKVQTSSQTLLANGSSATPSMTFTSEQNSGIYRSGTNDVRMSVNGSDVLSLKETSALTPAPAYVADTMAGTYLAASGIYSTRKLRSAYAGFAFNVTDGANTTVNLAFDFNGYIDDTVYLALVQPVRINTWFDQSVSGFNLTGEALNGGQKPYLVRRITPTSRYAYSVYFLLSRFLSSASGDAYGLNSTNHGVCFTFETPAPTAARQFLMSMASGSNVNEVLIGSTQPTLAAMSLVNDTIGFTAGTYLSMTGTGWHNVTAGARTTGTQNMGFRIDGTQYINSVTSSQTSSALQLVFGTRNASASEFAFIGYISDITVWPSSWISQTSAIDTYEADTLSYHVNGAGGTSRFSNILSTPRIGSGDDSYDLPAINTAVNGAVQAYNTSTKAMEWRGALSVLPASVIAYMPLNVNNDLVYDNPGFECYATNNATVTNIGTINTPTRVTYGAGTVTASHQHGFAIDTTTNIARVTYTGSRMRMVHCGLTMSAIHSAVNTNIRFYLYINGTLVPGSTVRQFSASNTDYGSTAIHSMPDLAPNDYIELYCQADKTGSVTVSDMNFFGMTMPNPM